MKILAFGALCICLLFTATCDRAKPAEATSPTLTAHSLAVANAFGLIMGVAEEHSDPTLWLSIPGEATGHNAVLVLLPEHVTIRRHDTNEAQHLYLWRPGQHGSRPTWVHTDNMLEYEAEFAAGIDFLARVSLQPDGVLFHYEFVNHSDFDVDSVQAITDPRMLSPLLRDLRLERTYVHEPGGFVLLASDMPERITMPLHEWLPNRYRISYAWPVDQTRVQRQSDGITFLNARSRADEPVIATVSTDRQWIMATFSRNPGNLWTNPDLTCQHADPEVALQHHSKGITEEKILLFRGTLDDVLIKVNEERGALK